MPDPLTQHSRLLFLYVSFSLGLRPTMKYEGVKSLSRPASPIQSPPCIISRVIAAVPLLAKNYKLQLLCGDFQPHTIHNMHFCRLHCHFPIIPHAAQIDCLRKFRSGIDDMRDGRHHYLEGQVSRVKNVRGAVWHEINVY